MIRRLILRLRRTMTAADLLMVVGIAAVAYGVALAWVPGGWIVVGVACILVARYGTEGH
jgi:hypothetical protein